MRCTRKASGGSRSPDPKEIPRRRLVAATFALETARAGLDHEWANSVDLIDWGWTQLSKERQPLPAERLWHLAAIALFQGALDVDELETRIGRLKSRFPDDPHVVLAQGWLTASIAYRAKVRTPGIITGPSTNSVAPMYRFAASLAA